MDTVVRRCYSKFRKFHRKTPVLESLFKKVAGLHACDFIKKRFQHRCFPMKFVKFFRTRFLHNTYGGCFCINSFQATGLSKCHLKPSENLGHTEQKETSSVKWLKEHFSPADLRFVETVNSRQLFYIFKVFSTFLMFLEFLIYFSENHSKSKLNLLTLKPSRDCWRCATASEAKFLQVSLSKTWTK